MLALNSVFKNRGPNISVGQIQPVGPQQHALWGTGWGELGQGGCVGDQRLFRPVCRPWLMFEVYLPDRTNRASGQVSQGGEAFGTSVGCNETWIELIPTRSANCSFPRLWPEIIIDPTSWKDIPARTQILPWGHRAVLLSSPTSSSTPQERYLMFSFSLLNYRFYSFFFS